MSEDFIPFTRPYLTGREVENVRTSIESLELVGDGPYTREVEQQISKISGGVDAFFTPSCTDALDMTSMLMDLEPGDEVIVPGFTFTSTATAYAQRNATLVFADIDPATLNINPQHVEALLTPRTRAIVAVHYAGIACDIDALKKIASRNNLTFVEDNAHGFGGTYKGEKLGTFGDMATLSFHATKNIQCGEGGALLTPHKTIADRAHILREKGTNRRAFIDGVVDKYTWVDHGSSFLAPDYVAAFLQVQLEDFELIQSKRQAVWEAYADQLLDWSQRVGARLPTVPDYAQHTSHLFWMTLATPEHRASFMKFLRDRGVGTTFHYQSLALSPAGKNFGRTDGTPVTDAVADTLVRLPLFADMTASMTERVIDTVLEWNP